MICFSHIISVQKYSSICTIPAVFLWWLLSFLPREQHEMDAPQVLRQNVASHNVYVIERNITKRMSF